MEIPLWCKSLRKQCFQGLGHSRGYFGAKGLGVSSHRYNCSLVPRSNSSVWLLPGLACRAHSAPRDIAPAFKSLRKQRKLLASLAQTKYAQAKAWAILVTARAKGLEPSTSRVTGGCSNQLSYARSFLNCSNRSFFLSK